MKRIAKVFISATCAAAVASLVGNTAVAASTSLATGFETGTLSDVSGTSANAVVGGSYAKTGSYGLALTASSSIAFAKFDNTQISQGYGYFTVRANVKVVSSTAGESVDLLTVKNAAGVNHFDIFVNPSGSFQWDLLGANSAVSTTKAAVGTWYLIEAKGYFGSSTYKADVRINGVAQTSITSVSQTPTAVSQYIFGSNGNIRTNKKFIDDAAVAVSGSALNYLGPPAGGVAPSPTTGCSLNQLTGSVNPNGEATTWHFEYGLTTTYGSRKPATDGSLSAGTTAVNVNSGNLNALAANTTYHYRLRTTNAYGTAVGVDRTLTTGSRPC